ncbi:hypothetical protein CWI38_0079p0030 [Hamiltosporidium tvaerminnensis]|uniref:Uncharacterized protein n=1 Tax=Hamiltosporidium tvaerminnensis TaxID=1176355 RepID=A0A4Q9M3T4_9MICR|nr:hypothetical protein CWI38_0079p0030 [Hamiltosporidium tvaerminnensis]
MLTLVSVMSKSIEICGNSSDKNVSLYIRIFYERKIVQEILKKQRLHLCLTHRAVILTGLGKEPREYYTDYVLNWSKTKSLAANTSEYLYDAIRALLVKNNLNLHPGCKEHFYLPRTELGRDLIIASTTLRSSGKGKEISTRCASILKYRLVEEVPKKNLEEAQVKKLYNKIEKQKQRQKLDSKLYNAKKNEHVSIGDSSRWPKKKNIRPRNEAGADGMCQHSTRCEKMLSHEYTRPHNEIVGCLHLLLLNRYKSHSVQEFLHNEYAEIRVDIRIKTDFGLIYKCSVEIIPYVMTWDGIVTNTIKIPMNVEAYIRSIVLKKTVETISFDRRRGLDSGLNAEGSWYRTSMGVIKRAEMHEEPTLILKQASRGEDFLEEPTINICEESEIEEETVAAKESSFDVHFKQNIHPVLKSVNGIFSNNTLINQEMNKINKYLSITTLASSTERYDILQNQRKI